MRVAVLLTALVLPMSAGCVFIVVSPSSAHIVEKVWSGTFPVPNNGFGAPELTDRYYFEIRAISDVEVIIRADCHIPATLPRVTLAVRQVASHDTLFWTGLDSGDHYEIRTSKAVRPDRYYADVRVAGAYPSGCGWRIVFRHF